MNQQWNSDARDQGATVIRRRMRRDAKGESVSFPWQRAVRNGSSRLGWEEELIPDARAALRPAQWVERKLIALLTHSLLPISHLRLAAFVRGQRPMENE